jgi:hypothetical protein
MIPHHARLVDATPPDITEYLLRYFDLWEPRGRPPSWRLSHALAEAGVGQADVVLALLRSDQEDFRHCAEALVGRPIYRAPRTALPAAPPPRGDSARTGDERRVTRVVGHNPRLPSTPAWHRHRIFRPGMTVRQFLTRGGRRGDVRLAVRRGWVELEDER